MPNEISPLSLVGLSGHAGCGKDYIYSTYFQPRGWMPFAYSWHFKVWLVGRGKATHEEIFHTKPPEIRKLIQRFGTEEGRDVWGEDIWNRILFEWLAVLNENMGINKFVITDVRFPNEFHAIREHGGKILRINAPRRVNEARMTAEARQHSSETSLSTLRVTDFDGVIFNDVEHYPFWGTIEEQLDKILESFGW